VVRDAIERDVLDCVGRLLKEEWRFTVGIGASFNCMRSVVSPDAVDTSDRKGTLITQDRNRYRIEGKQLPLPLGCGGATSHRRRRSDGKCGSGGD
jgi:hypothetical protein